MPLQTESVSTPTGSATILRCGGQPTRGRRWLQISLRAFLALTTLASIALGWLGIQIDHARRQRSAVEAMKDVSVGFSYQPMREAWCGLPNWDATKPPPTPAFVRRMCGDNIFADVVSLSSRGHFETSDLVHVRALKTLEWLSIETSYGPEITDSDLAAVGELIRLKGLDVSSSDVTDAGLAHLAGLRSLERLDLSFSEVTDAGLQHLAGLKNLERLALSGTKVTGTGLSYLSNCMRLKRLELDGAPVTNEGARCLEAFENLEELRINRLDGDRPLEAGDAILKSCAKLRRLQALHLGGAQVTGAGLRHLRGITTLETLYLDSTQVCGEGLKELSALPALTSLDLSSTPVSDADLRYIGRLTNLEGLKLDCTQITDAGLAQLSNLKKLEVLDLQCTSISDEGLIHLRSLKNLQCLGDYQTKVTKRGREQLREVIPSLHVHE